MVVGRLRNSAAGMRWVPSHATGHYHDWYHLGRSQSAICHLTILGPHKTCRMTTGSVVRLPNFSIFEVGGTPKP